MRKLATIIGAISLVAAACSGGSADTSTTTSTTPVVVTTSSTTPPSTMVVPAAISTQDLEIWAPGALLGPLADGVAGFEIETGIDVEITAVELDVMLEMLLEDPAGGPDLFVGPHAWLTTLTEAGLAEPITVDPSVVSGAAAGVELRDTTYAAPIGLDTIAQFRNTTSLGSSPATFEAFADGCVVSGATVPCLALATDSVEGHWAFITTLGGYLFGPDEFAGWDKDDVGVATADALAGGLILEDVVAGTGILGDGASTALDRFIAGETPLYWGTTADVAALELAGVPFSVERLPTIGDQPAAGPVETVAIWVNAFSMDKEAAVRLVEEHLALPEVSSTLAIALGLAPVVEGFTADADLAPFTAAATIGLPVPPIPATELAWAELAIAFDSIRGGGSSADALGAAASSIRAGA